MEKSTSNRRNFIIPRLLIFVLVFLFLGTSLFAYRYSSLKVKPKSPYAFTGEECVFELIVPKVSPKILRTTIQSLPEGVTFISSKKEEVLINDENATAVELVFTFSKPGVYKLPKLAARIAYGGYSLEFLPVEIIENPLTLVPELYFELPKQSTYYAGEKIYLKLKARYFHCINSLSIPLDENFVLIQKSSSMDFPFVLSEFSNEEFEIGVYECVALKEGKFQLPLANVSFEAWNGSHPFVSSQEITLEFKYNGNYSSEKKTYEKLEKSQDIISNLISPEESTENNFSNSENSFYQMARIEKMDGVLKTKKILSVLRIIFIVIFSILIITLVIFLLLKKRKIVILVSIVSIIFLFFIIGFSVPLSKEYCVSKETNLYKIPEENSLFTNQLSKGILLKIESKTDGWYQVSVGTENLTNQLYWVKTDSVEILK